MAQLSVIRMDQSPAAPLEVSDSLVEAPYHPYLVRDAVVYQLAKARQGTHSTRTRATLAASKIKLYRQKGTGRARAGSAKAPQRRHGAIVHGPLPRDHAIGLNKKTRKQALRGALAEKIRRKELVVLEALAPESHKTQAFAAWLAKLEAPAALIVVDEANENLVRATRNLPKVELIRDTQLNVYNLLRYAKTLITRRALQRVEERTAP
jgi:large subunit ribosomal protein L4